MHVINTASVVEAAWTDSLSPEAEQRPHPYTEVSLDQSPRELMQVRISKNCILSGRTTWPWQHAGLMCVGDELR